MRKKMLVALVAGIATALSLPQAGEAASVNSGRGDSVPPPILVPQTPPPPIFNPGVTPSAPGPSTITPSPRSSAGLATTAMPGPATGSSLRPGRARGSHGRANRDQTRAVNEMQREIDHGISICRGC